MVRGNEIAPTEGRGDSRLLCLRDRVGTVFKTFREIGEIRPRARLTTEETTEATTTEETTVAATQTM